VINDGQLILQWCTVLPVPEAKWRDTVYVFHKKEKPKLPCRIRDIFYNGEAPRAGRLSATWSRILCAVQYQDPTFPKWNIKYFRPLLPSIYHAYSHHGIKKLALLTLLAHILEDTVDRFSCSKKSIALWLFYRTRCVAPPPPITSKRLSLLSVSPHLQIPLEVAIRWHKLTLCVARSNPFRVLILTTAYYFNLLPPWQFSPVYAALHPHWPIGCSLQPQTLFQGTASF